MAHMLASVEWPGLTYLLKRRLEELEFELNITDTSALGRLDWLTQELCCYFRPRRVEIVGVSAKDLLEEAHLTVYGTIGLMCRVCWVSGGDVSAGSVLYTSTLRDEVSLRATSSGEV